MTREEIEKDRQYQLTGAAIDYCRKELPHYDGEALGEITDAFEAGAEWEHKRLVEKACSLLISSLSQLRSEYGRRLVFVNKSDFIESFKKAMEE